MIDISKWKDFKLSDIFQINRGDMINIQKVLDGDVPIVSSATTNNGISRFGDIEPNCKAGALTVSINGECGFTALQIIDFFASSDCAYLVPLKNIIISDDAKLFIASIITSATKKYNWSDKLTLGLLNEMKILLPYNEDGNPDYNFMDNFIQNKKRKVSTALDFLNNIDFSKKTLNLTSWKSFRLDSLFNIKKGSRLTRANMIPGNINYIGASAFNNGITQNISNDEKLHPKNTITVNYNGSTGKAFYQMEQFWASDDVNILYPKFNLNEEIALFLIPLIEIKGREFSFINKWTLKHMNETEILLPVTSSKEPDWKYMESYIANLKENVKDRIDLFK